MPTTNFPMRPRRDDPVGGYLTVQQMVEYLRDVFDKFKDSFVRGQATVASGATTVSVAMAASPGSTYSVVVQPLVNPGGTFWVSAKTGTSFTINLAVAAPAGGCPFDYIAKGI
jgi:hypothetical protein